MTVEELRKILYIADDDAPVSLIRAGENPLTCSADIRRVLTIETLTEAGVVKPLVVLEYGEAQE